MTPDERVQPTTPRTRRSLLAAAAAAGGALATQALVRPSPVAGANVVLGAINTAGAATTIRNTQALNSAKALVGLVTYAGAGPSTAGVQGQSLAANGNGVFGVALSGANSKGVWGRSANGRGVFGEATATSGLSYGVYGESKSSGGVGVAGSGGANGVAGTGATGIYGKGTALGVYGEGNETGVSGLGQKWGVVGAASSGGGGGGVYGVGPVGVEGRASGAAYTFGVYGLSSGIFGDGVYGVTTAVHNAAAGVRGLSNNATAFAGYFEGKVHVGGTFSSSNKLFLIDHPQDPANKTLTHACVEAPEMLNVYSGTATLDAKGQATVRMPRYFRALNTDYRYQLTAIGAQAPGLYVARKIQRSSFAIAGGIPGQEVCWQVTGVRQDAWAQKHPLRVERAKKRKDRGKYLNPEVFGKPKSAAMHPAPKMLRRPRRLPRPKAA